MIPTIPAAAPTDPAHPPRLVPSLIERVCAAGERPFLLTGFFRDACIRHFYAAGDQVEDIDYRGLVWQPGETTHILIESLYKWKPELTEKRPAILIKRNGYKRLRIGLGMGTLGVNEQGDYEYASFVVGSHTLFCLGNTASIADGIASEMDRHFVRYAPAYRRFLNLFQLQVTEISAANDVEESDYNYSVTIDIGWSYQETWTLAQEALPLVRVSLSALMEGFEQPVSF